MTYFEDSLSAFSAITHRLSTGLSTSFRSGLPVCDFPYAVGWRQITPTTRDRRFPSWSWAAYPGQLSSGATEPYVYQDWQLTEDERVFYEPYFRVEETYNDDIKIIYERNTEEIHRQPWEATKADVEILKISALPFQDNLTGNKSFHQPPRGLIVEGIVLTFHLEGPATFASPNTKYPIATFKAFLGTTECQLLVTSTQHAEAFWGKSVTADKML
jgi:hypothetical protein